MSKGNKILAGCLALLLALSVGYALFSETITINGTATAKGNFDITATCTPGLLDTMGLTSEDLRFDEEGGYENSSCDVVGNKVFLHANLLYPSATRHFTIKLTNTGTITAENPMADADEPFFDAWIFHNIKQNICELNENNEKINCSESLSYESNTESYSGTFMDDEIAGFGDKDGNFYSMDSDQIINFFNLETELIQLEPGESMYITLSMYWPEGYTNANNSANLSFELTTDIPFVQAE